MIRTRWRELRSSGDERGYSVFELIIVMAIMGVVMTGLTTIFVSGSKAELDMNQRFQAQSAGRLALDKLRRELHCASGATSTGSTLTLTMPTGCKTASNTTATWCTSQVGTSTTRYALYRYEGSGTCTAGVQWADYITQASTFTFTQQSSSSLAKVGVYLPISLTPGARAYALQDDIYLRNSTRTCITGSPSPPC